MASRRFFEYDPYDYYYTASPYHFPSSYHHHQQPAPPARRAGGFFPVADGDADGDADQYYYGYQPEPTIPRNAGGSFPSIGEFDPYYRPAPARRAGVFVPAAGKVESRSDGAAARRVSSIPVRSVPEPEPEEDARVPVKRALSAEEAAVRVQAAARGFLARKAVRALRAVEREAAEVAERVAREAEALRGDARARVAVGEQLMRLLFRLDTVRGAREYRKTVAKRVLALQDAVDALEQQRTEEGEAEASATSTVETVAEEPAEGDVEENGEIHGNAAAEMEVDEDRVAAGDEEPAPSGANLGADMPGAEGEWEMVAEEHAVTVPAAAQSPAEPRQPAAEETTRRPAVADGGDVDAKKLMEMVAALCQQSAQQCAAIGALADRVDALECAVRRVEDAERRRRRGKKLRKQGKGTNHVNNCYSD